MGPSSPGRAPSPVLPSRMTLPRLHQFEHQKMVCAIVHRNADSGMHQSPLTYWGEAGTPQGVTVETTDGQHRQEERGAAEPGVGKRGPPSTAAGRRAPACCRCHWLLTVSLLSLSEGRRPHRCWSRRAGCVRGEARGRGSPRFGSRARKPRRRVELAWAWSWQI